MNFFRPMVTFFFLMIVGCCVGSPCSAVENSDAGDGGAAAEIEQAHLEVLQSPRWIKAKSDFDKWLSVQTVYSDAQIQVLESEMRNKIAQMTADELQDFLTEMEEKLAILLSPETTGARQWVNKYYTEKAQQRMAKKYGVEDPMSLSAEEVAAALTHFYEDRQSRQASSAAFDRARKSQNTAAKEYRATQQKASAQAARQARSRPSPSRTSYAPRQKKPQVYRSPYPKGRYSVGPWGGVWRH